VGKVYGPEGVVHRKGKPVPDLTPAPMPQPITPIRLKEIRRDIASIKVEIAKIKLALKAHGIAIE
jgi:hypothetical protein